MIQPSDIQVVIPSRRRAEEAKYCAALWPSPVVCVADEEVDDYQDVGVPVVPHPPTRGLGQLRQWILDNFPHRCVVMCNDDVRALMCLVGKRARRITDPQAIFQAVWNAAVIAEGIGISCFSFSPTQDLRKFNTQDPFRFTRLEGALFGFIGRRIRFDPKVMQHDDVDVTLQACLQDRIVWQDSRFAVAHNFQTKGGGNSEMRGSQRSREELLYMRAKWGDYLGWTPRDSVISVAVGVPRRQPLEV